MRLGLGNMLVKGGVLASLDPDAKAYIAAVEAADGQALEPAIRLAYDRFVRGCKSDNIWNAIKASCILSGARSLSGALVPLRGAAPTNYNFVSGDYSRTAGLLGDGTTKYLDSNRDNNADPQDSKHVSIYSSQISTGVIPAYFGGAAESGSTQLLDTIATIRMSYRLNSVSAALVGLTPSIGFIGLNRPDSSNSEIRNAGITTTSSNSSASPTTFSLLFYRRTNLAGSNYNNGRFSFYSIGEAIDLAALDARVATLTAAISAALP
jgi:hypothetical protein